MMRMMIMTAIADTIIMIAAVEDITITTHMTAGAAATHTSTHTVEWMHLKRIMTMCTLHRDS